MLITFVNQKHFDLVSDNHFLLYNPVLECSATYGSCCEDAIWLVIHHSFDGGLTVGDRMVVEM